MWSVFAGVKNCFWPGRKIPDMLFNSSSVEVAAGEAANSGISLEIKP